jgi:L-alanine-DL-glutamate epimerase-like enolase superfamily enzyme
MPGKTTAIRVVGAELYFLPIKTRVPLKFGPETLTEVTCARTRVWVEDGKGNRAEGWGETPLSVQWVWPSKLSHAERHETLKKTCERLVKEWVEFGGQGHPMEIGYDFQEQVLRHVLAEINRDRIGKEAMPWLGALVCCSPFDIAVHDAYGQLHGVQSFQTYGSDFMNRDLSGFAEAEDAGISFTGKYPNDFLRPKRRERLPAWHLVGGLDVLDAADLKGDEPKDGYPVLLGDWIKTDGLKCLKIKLRGNDAKWDYERLLKVAEIGFANGVEWLTSDFNCTVQEPRYVNEILDRLKAEQPRCFEALLYVEQPFPYELEEHRINVHSVASRKPLFLDESAHDWRMVRLGRELGWNGVALKTCKTLTGALLSACWAKAHGMSLMVQDLTNPMLAQIPHVQLAAHVDTIMGVETNGMQFYPEASKAEAVVHPGIYQRRNGEVNLSSIRGPGLGYRLSEIQRELPEPAAKVIT